MSDPTDPPVSPESIPTYLADGLPKQDPETLRTIAAYAMDLADYKQAQVDRELHAGAVDEDDTPPADWDQDEWAETLEDVAAPGKATLTVKTINDNDYYYYQWREGESIKSAYVAPVSPSDS